MKIDFDAIKEFMDIERLRRGFFTDKYFLNVQTILQSLSRGCFKELNHPHTSPSFDVSSAKVEMQVFTRRPGETVICGLNFALACLKYCTGHWERDQFVDTSDELDVWAIDEGELAQYSGDPSEVTPILRIHGSYKEFAINETLILGYLSRASRVATNIYKLLTAANGKPLLFFPARYDIPEVQVLDGYAYSTAIKLYNRIHSMDLEPFISTDAQGGLINTKGGGTIPHAAIACFLGNTVNTTLAFAEIIPASVNRVALVDFNNDSVGTSIAVAKELFLHYLENVKAGSSEAQKYKLFGVRLDTSSALRDVAVPDTGDPKADNGVNPTLVRLVREGLDNAWKTWGLGEEDSEIAREYCESVKIVASGGFNEEKIRRFEEADVPVDIYAVGSAAFDNHGPTVTDFTADVVRISIDGQWEHVAKVGRKANTNPDLKKVCL